MRSLRSACGVALLLAAHAVAPSSAAAQSAPSRAAVQAAVEDLRRDPNLGRDKTVKTLRWTDSKAAPPPAEAPNWIVGLFQFISQAAGVLLWIGGGIGLAIAVIWMYRVYAGRRSERGPRTPRAVSHVQDLDIRPASLPADVGAAALELLAAGRTRESLSLLYRGALSRAVHNFSVVIGESYTEGEALRAVNRRLDETRARYFSALVGLWQQTVYAADIPPAESVASLCRDFSPVLGGAPI